MDTQGLRVNVEPVLEARSVVKRYGHVTALDHADFDLYPNEILAVIGDNGAGKSSLIKALCGAVIPDSGEIKLAGRVVHFKSPIEARMAGIETVYQSLALSPALSIADNMFLGRELRWRGPIGGWFRALDRGAMQKFAREKLNELGLMTIQNINQPVERIANKLVQMWGNGAAWARDPEAGAHEAHYLRLDASKARTELGWEPKLKIETALEWTMGWYRAWNRGENMANFTLQQIEDYSKL